MAKRCSQTRPARTKGADDAKRVAVQLYTGVHHACVGAKVGTVGSAVGIVGAAVTWEPASRPKR